MPVIYFLASLIIHIGLILGIASIQQTQQKQQAEQKQGQGQPPRESVKVKIIEKPKEENKVKMKIATKKEPSKTKVAEPEVKNEEKCPQFYYGIGIYTDPSLCVVTKVYPGYSADRSGIKPGDMILIPNCGSIRGTREEEFDMTLIRQGEIINLKINREKICEG